jgi:hypothetical protein
LGDTRGTHLIKRPEFQLSLRLSEIEFTLVPDLDPSTGLKYSFRIGIIYTHGPRNIIRDWRRGTTACPACWAIGTNEVKVREKIFCNGPTRAPKAGQESLVPASQAQRIKQERITFICTSVSTVRGGYLSLVSLVANLILSLGVEPRL